MQPIIEIRNVSRTYKPGHQAEVNAVQSLNLTIGEGEIIALTGPSGSGKSTLMHLIGGIDKPNSGEIVVAGKTISALSESQLTRYRNQTVGIIFQFFYLQPFLTVAENVEVPLMFAHAKRTERTNRTAEVLDAVGLRERSSFLPKELSGGQIQRTAIARALVGAPRILLADEPTGNLDSANSQSIMQLLRTLRDAHDMTIVIITHDPTVAAWVDRVVTLKDGRIAA